LFAILRVRANPFCVLNEIDAALDEANVSRFADLLAECAQNTQVIIVTHRKGTMNRADALYGVTMEQNGISKVLSIDLQEASA
jgi:chromosome segregation protein